MWEGWADTVPAGSNWRGRNVRSVLFLNSAIRKLILNEPVSKNLLLEGST